MVISIRRWHVGSAFRQNELAHSTQHLSGAKVSCKMAGKLDPHAVEEAMMQLAKQKPLIQCITNFVSMDLMANVLLAAGASPAMVSLDLLEVHDLSDRARSRSTSVKESLATQPVALRMR